MPNKPKRLYRWKKIKLKYKLKKHYKLPNKLN